MGALLHCPRCNSIYVRRSARRNGIEVLRACFLVSPFRCWDCKHRFFVRYRKPEQRGMHPL
jgi:transposase-like protein